MALGVVAGMCGSARQIAGCLLHSAAWKSHIGRSFGCLVVLCAQHAAKARSVAHFFLEGRAAEAMECRRSESGAERDRRKCVRGGGVWGHWKVSDLPEESKLRASCALARNLRELFHQK